MIGKSNIADCDETCKYKEVYQIYKAAYNSAWNEFSFQTGIIMVLLSFVIVTDSRNNKMLWVCKFNCRKSNKAESKRVLRSGPWNDGRSFCKHD